ncbi:Syntaxin-52-like protein [Drosera capensis]
MASAGDSWIREFNEAAKLAEDINGMISEKAAVAYTGQDSQRHFSAVRRKITILGTRIDSLESLLAKLPSRQPMSDKEMNRRRDMLSNLRSKTNQMASTLSMSNFGNRDTLLGPEIKPDDAMTRVAGLDNQGIVSLQRHSKMKDLKSWRRRFVSVLLLFLLSFGNVNVLLLIVNTHLQDTLDYHVDATGSRLQRIQKNLAVLNKRTKGGCSCLCLTLSVAGVVILILVIFVLIKYL